ncbi:MAG: methylenetetrahydrofolate reductase [Hydrogenophilus sp.]|nr:methylenetetrahydrofolate reductase [Hydrogenophilus sp.]
MEWSVEFFPPQGAEGFAKLMTAAASLQRCGCFAFASVTYGAGGSTRERTFAAVARLQEAGWEVAPHLSGIGSDRAAVAEILDRYAMAGVRRLVLLRGDLPSGVVDPGEFRYAVELVTFVRARYGDRFWIAVAAYPEYHPQARSAAADLEAFAAKMAAGADCAITQFFFNADAYAYFVEEARRRGVFQPIVPGIMPITCFSRLARFADQCGAEIPRWIRRTMEGLENDSKGMRAFGEEVVFRLLERLRMFGAPGFHFYTLNQAEPTLALIQRLGMGERRGDNGLF